MKYLSILLLAGLFLFAGCDKDSKEKEFTITFKAVYDGAPLVKNINYNYDTYTVQFSRFSAYMSDIRLLKGTEEVMLSEIEYLDFTPAFASNDNAVDVTIKVKAKEGDYTGIKMGYGVKQSLNAKAPADFASGHVLNKEEEYWSGWKSYIFNKIEGQGDGDGDGTPDIFLVYHCGSDKVYRDYSFDHAFTLTENANLNVEFDLKKLFVNDGVWFDLNENSNQATSNELTDTRVARFLMENFDQATTIK